MFEDFKDTVSKMFDPDGSRAKDFASHVDQLRAGKSGKCPAAKPAADRKELARWFTQFAIACRAALPKQEAAK